MAQTFDRYPYRPGMLVVLKKKHPCGGREWLVLRVGADVRLQCRTCGRQMLMSRRSLEKATRSVTAVEAGTEEGDEREHQ